MLTFGLSVGYNKMCIWVSAWRQSANLICYQGCNVHYGAPVAQPEAQPTCNRQVSGFESPLGLFSI